VNKIGVGVWLSLVRPVKLLGADRLEARQKLECERGVVPAAPKPAPRIATDPGVSLRDELARELIERRLGIKEEPVDSPRIDFETFLATIASKYVRAGLCPPFRLRGFASSWIASGIDPQHCFSEVARHLDQYAGKPELRISRWPASAPQRCRPAHLGEPRHRRPGAAAGA
jgi:hypothetical protein